VGFVLLGVLCSVLYVIVCPFGHCIVYPSAIGIFKLILQIISIYNLLIIVTQLEKSAISKCQIDFLILKVKK
jgi:hypothetical protein